MGPLSIGRNALARETALDTLIAELEARLLSEGDQLLGDRKTVEWLARAKERASDLDPLTEGVTGLFKEILRP